jgi:ParB family chromosome partitioning protein
VSTNRAKKSSGAMANIIAQGQENVDRLSETFRDAPVTEVPTDYLMPSANNPRKRISASSIEEMVNGIRQTGGEILQPLLVRPIPLTDRGERYEVVCGNRRLLGAQRLGMKRIPVRVREMDDDTAARFALWENLSREDLSPMDLAESIDDLRKIDRLSWEQIGERFGFSRQWGWKQQKLAELPESVRELVREGQIAPSKAMLIAQEALSESEAVLLAHRIVTNDLSHRALQTELRRKHVSTSPDQPASAAGRKHVLTWNPPPSIARRKHARLLRATEELVATANEGLLTAEYARSLRPLLEHLQALGEEAPPGEPPAKQKEMKVGENSPPA